MKYYNKHILVGQYDWYGRFHYDTILSLHENHRPVWLVELEDENGGITLKKSKRVIPTLEHMIEDGLILLAYEIEKNEMFIQFLNKLLDDKKWSMLEMYELSEEKRKLILTKLKTIDFHSDLTCMGLSVKEAKTLNKYKLKATFMCPVEIKMKN